ncbi:MAG: hypothetical protein KF878_25460, partial [Planctomycetes bacterium]|nr:hypothetical protein [Planctomycetota bacterium]
RARDALAREVAALRAEPGAPRELEVHDDALDLTRLDLPRGALIELHLPDASAAGEPRLEAGGRLLWPAPGDAGPGLRFWVLSDDLPPDGRLRLVGGRAGRRAEVQALPLPAGAAARVGALLRAAGVVGGGA